MQKLKLKKITVPSNFCIVLIGVAIIIPHLMCKELEIWEG